MRTSLLKTNVARLRTFLGNQQPGYLGGMQQSDFAQVCGLKLATLQSIESRRLDLSPELALRIIDATSVDLSWLLSKDLTAPIRANDGSEYSYDHFAVTQATKAQESGMSIGASIKPFYLIGLLKRIVDVVESVSSRQGGAVEIVYWKISQLLEQLEKEHEVEIAGSANPNIEDLAKRLERLVELDRLLVQPLAPIRKEALQIATGRIKTREQKGSHMSPEERGKIVTDTYRTLESRNLPGVDSTAMVELEGPPLHLHPLEANKTARKSKPSERPTRRRRGKPE